MTETEQIRIKAEGYTAFSSGKPLVQACPYYPGSTMHTTFVNGWEVAQFEQEIQKDCPWRSRVICMVSKAVCNKEVCGLWYFKTKVGRG